MPKLLGRGPRTGALAGAICLAALAALLAWQVPGGAGPAQAAAPKPPPTDALEVILRLGDLPLGYVVIDGSPVARVGGLMCDRIDPANAQPQLDDFLTRNKPAGCLALYYRTYRIAGAQPEPLVVGTGAMRLASAEAAAEGLAVAPQLLSHTLNDELPEEVPATSVVGDASRLFHWRHGELFGEGEEDVSFFIWRAGAVDAAVMVAGGAPAANDRAAVELAQRQQARIEHPSPVSRSDFDDTEVALEDPALKAPVYWLGKTFDPGRGLAPMRLQGSSSSSGRSPFTPRVALVYGDHPLHRRYEEVYLDLYSSRQWRQLRGEAKRLPGALACGATSRRLKVPGASVIVFHGKEKLLGRCRKSEPRSWTLRVRLHGLVAVAQTTQVCGVCAEAGRGPYDTLRGMTAIARGLERRERPSAGS
jgi:hypothetical protein